MPLSKVWSQPKTNVLMTQDVAVGVRTQYALWHLKDGLVNSTVGAWTVVASSGENNGGGSLVASTQDNWIVPEDVWFGQPNSTSARAWTVLESPNSDFGRFYLTIDYWSTGPAEDYRCQLYFSNTKPDLLSFSPTARPAAAGPEWNHLDIVVFNTFLAKYRFDCNLVTAHDGSFVFFGSYADNPVITTALLFNVMGDPKPQDSSGAVSLHWGGLANKMDQDALPAFQGLHPVDSTQVNIQGVSLEAGTATAPRVMDVLPDDTAAKGFTRAPVWLFSSDLSRYSLRGQLQDVYWAPTAYPETVVAYEENIFTFTKVGPFWVPVETPPMT